MIGLAATLAKALLGEARAVVVAIANGRRTAAAAPYTVAA